MEQRLLPIGIQDFSEVITNNLVYVDKTELVYRLTHTSGKAFFLSRPRRFGKSLLCSTLRYYFEGRKELFTGLALDKLETEWKQYPVFHFDISQCKADNIEIVTYRLSRLLTKYEQDYGLESSSPSLGDRLQTLIETAHERTGNQAVLIFDEYDSVMLHALNNPENMKEVRGIFSEFFGPVKYMDKYLRFVFITGITKFSQMSIFSTINNLNNISMYEEWESICGLTQVELEGNFEDRIVALGKKNGWTLEQTMVKLRERYDGYHFGPALTGIYNPFSILNALNRLQLSDYWFNSATPSALIETLRHYPFELDNLEGVIIPQDGFDQPFDNFSTAIPILYQSGYLTIKDYDPDMEEYTLDIPNSEVRHGLYRTLLDNYINADTSLNASMMNRVRQAIRKDDIDLVLTTVKNYLAALPNHLSNKTERDFQTIMRIIFEGAGGKIYTEQASAIGRSDIVLTNASTIYVLELKMSKRGTVDDALAQIDAKNYFAPYADDPRRKVKVAVVFDEATRTINDWKIEE